MTDPYTHREGKNVLSRNHFKRASAITLTCALTAALAACGGSSDSDSGAAAE